MMGKSIWMDGFWYIEWCNGEGRIVVCELYDYWDDENFGVFEM